MTCRKNAGLCCVGLRHPITRDCREELAAVITKSRRHFESREVSFQIEKVEAWDYA